MGPLTKAAILAIIYFLGLATGFVISEKSNEGKARVAQGFISLLPPYFKQHEAIINPQDSSNTQGENSHKIEDGETLSFSSAGNGYNPIWTLCSKGSDGKKDCDFPLSGETFTFNKRYRESGSNSYELTLTIQHQSGFLPQDTDVIFLEVSRQLNVNSPNETSPSWIQSSKKQADLNNYFRVGSLDDKLEYLCQAYQNGEYIAGKVIENPKGPGSVCSFPLRENSEVKIPASEDAFSQRIFKNDDAAGTSNSYELLFTQGNDLIWEEFFPIGSDQNILSIDNTITTRDGKVICKARFESDDNYIDGNPVAFQVGVVYEGYCLFSYGEDLGYCPNRNHKTNNCPDGGYQILVENRHFKDSP